MSKNIIKETNKIDYSLWESGNDANWYSDDPILTRYSKRYLSKTVLDYVKESFKKTGALAAGPIDKRAVHTDRSRCS